MFQLLDNVKRGQRKRPGDVTSLVDTALTNSEYFLHTDLEKGLRYYRLAAQHYHNMNPKAAGFEEIEFRIASLFVAYFKKQAETIPLQKSTLTAIFINNPLYQA